VKFRFNNIFEKSKGTETWLKATILKQSTTTSNDEGKSNVLRENMQLLFYQWYS